ncbi:MAG: hypothetical protein F6K09_26575, partial [Merismopedia sp. SIO2A8]|nr:hypothetical protein [Merismopedia sp. SIO2A8]
MATMLSAGDIAIIGINTDDPDDFSFVLLRDIEVGTEITFTDSGWLNSGEFQVLVDGTLNLPVVGSVS